MSHPVWSIILIFGVAGWIATTIAGIFKAFPDRGRIEHRRAAPWFAASVMFFFIWIVGMLNA